MKTLRRMLVIAAVLAAAVPATAHADAVTTWNQYATNLLVGPAPSQAPPVAAVNLAIVHGAVYDAVNAIDGSRDGYLISSRVATPFDSKEAAAATAAYRVLLNLVPAQQSVLDAQHAASLAGIPDGTQKTRGIAVGEAAAAAMIAARTADGRAGSFRFPVGSLPGEWKPVLPLFVNDPNAWLKDVTPFMIPSASQFRSKGPNELESHAYARDFEEVKSVGSASSGTRSADQTHAALYWMEHPLGTWSRIARAMSAEHGLSIVDSARFFAMLYLTASDAAISVWDDKAHWLFWRPITAIREADTDLNPATEKDGGWLPLVPTPPYPDHPSGHAGVSASIIATMQDFFGTDHVAFEDTNNAGRTRHWARLSQAIDEIVDARVWSGIHFRIADEQGEKIGREVARWREKHFFRPVHHAEDD